MSPQATRGLKSAKKVDRALVARSRPPVPPHDVDSTANGKFVACNRAVVNEKVRVAGFHGILAEACRGLVAFPDHAASTITIESFDPKNDVDLKASIPMNSIASTAATPAARGIANPC